MSRRRMTGVCHICGKNGPLTFEHVPPRAAFNNRRVVTAGFDEVIRLGPDEVPTGPVQQRGAGGYTLCASCNNRTGSWYGRSFVDWCYQGMDILIRSGGKPSLIYMNYLFPLRVIKQIATMFFSVNGEQFSQVHPVLVRFILNREQKYLPPRYRFFAYYNMSGKCRYSGVVAKVDTRTGKPFIYSEITYPPFGYVMTLDSQPPDPRLSEITGFSRFSYNEFRVFNLRLPVLQTHLWYPGDYRTEKEILRDRAKGELAMKQQRDRTASGRPI